MYATCQHVKRLTDDMSKASPKQGAKNLPVTGISLIRSDSYNHSEYLPSVLILEQFENRGHGFLESSYG
jgi:hypothetical protein